MVSTTSEVRCRFPLVAAWHNDGQKHSVGRGIPYGRWKGHVFYSGLRPPLRTTLPHLSVSSAISLPKSAGEPGIGAPPMAASFAFMPPSAIAALISLLSLSTISAGVFLGAAKPYHWLAS